MYNSSDAEIRAGQNAVVARCPFPRHARRFLLTSPNPAPASPLRARRRKMKTVGSNLDAAIPPNRHLAANLKLTAKTREKSRRNGSVSRHPRSVEIGRNSSLFCHFWSRFTPRQPLHHSEPVPASISPPIIGKPAQIRLFRFDQDLPGTSSSPSTRLPEGQRDE